MTMDYSRLVRALKFALPSIGVLFFLAIILWPDRHQKIKSDSPQIKEEQELLHLINARFYTSDKKSQPIALTADKAEEMSAGSNLIKLTGVHADIQLKNKTFVTAKIDEAVYDQAQSTLRASTPAQLQTDNGYTLTLHGATFDLAKRTLKAGRTSGAGPLGDLTAGFIEYQDKQRLFTLTTKPKITVLHDKRKSVVSADRIVFNLNKDEIDTTGDVKVSIDESQFTADKAKISHGLVGKKRVVQTITAGPRVVFKTTSQTATGDSLVYKARQDLGVLKGTPVILTMEGMEIQAPEIHYVPSEMTVSAVGNVIIRRADGSTVTGDVMKVYLGQNHKPLKLEGIGNIIAKTKEETLYSDFAVYYFDTQILRAEHNIVLIKGENRLSGDFATLDFVRQISSIEKTSTPVEAVIDPMDENLKNTGQPFQKGVKESHDSIPFEKNRKTSPLSGSAPAP